MNEEQLKKDKELLEKWKEYEGAKYHMTTFFSEGMGHQFVIEELLEAQARVSTEEVRKNVIKLIKQEMKDNLMKCDCYVNRCECNDSPERILKFLSNNPEQND